MKVRPTVQGDIAAIIPTCDRPDFLREALASVQAQELPPREILVVDNGTVPVNAADLPPGIQLLRIAPRAGPSRARNLGAASATSAYLAFLDDDDRWGPSFLREAFAVLQREGLRCVYGRKMLQTSDTLTDYKMATADSLNAATLLRINPGTGGMNLLIERSLFLEIGGFDERLRLSEDRALALELVLRKERIGFAPDAIAIVRHHGSDRLRQHSIRKLSFVWKYRRLYPAMEFATAIARIFAAAAFSMIRGRMGDFREHQHGARGASEGRSRR